MRSALLVSLLSAATITSGTGCSLMFVNGPPSQPPPDQVELPCTKQYVLPVVDGVVAANSASFALLGLFGWGISSSAPAYDPQDQRDNMEEATAFRNIFLVAGALTLLTTISTVQGFRNVSACKAAQANIDGAPHIIFGRPPGPTAPAPPPSPPPSATPPGPAQTPLDPPLPDAPPSAAVDGARSGALGMR